MDTTHSIRYAAEHGKEAIDAFVFDDNGQLYITWKAYGLALFPLRRESLDSGGRALARYEPVPSS